jgi:hypothetical protein
VRKAALAGAIALFLWGAFVALTGGIDARVFGIVIRSRDPFRAFVGSLAFVLLYAALNPRELPRKIDALIALLLRYVSFAAAGLALALAAHAVAFGSFGVGGSDVYGYVNQAYDWASGALPQPIPLTLTLPFPESDQLQAPLGYRPGQAPGTIVPTYAPGLPLMMAAMIPLGACGPFLVVPCFAAIFVWWTFRLGERVAGPVTGLIAAIVLITSPVVLYQVLWPMSDVPAGALWTGAALFSLGDSRRSAVASGLLTSAGLLIRPNLLPLAVLPLAVAARCATGRERWVRTALYLICLVPTVAFVAVLNAKWFGSPLNSGYGAANEIYLAANVIPNLQLYGSWLWTSQSGWMLVALLPIVPVFRRGVNRPALLLCTAVCGGVLACYVTYSQFEMWWYLRFLLPGFGALAVLIAAGLSGVARQIRPYGLIAAMTALALMTMRTVSFAANAGVFGRLQAGERRYADIGDFAATALPPNAALFSMQHSGSLRFYTGRLSLRYDQVPKERAREVIAAIERAGYHPYLIIDEWETPYVRTQFGLPDGPLRWPIRARMRELGGLAVYDLATSPGADSPVALEPTSHRWCDARHRVETIR